MKKLLILNVLVLFGVVFAQKGNLVGVVYDEYGLTMPGAVVRVNNTELYAVTNVNGSYTISGIDAGEQEVSLSYIGYDEVTKKVNVIAGKSVELILNLYPSTNELKEVEITGTLTGQAKALSLQKSNPNITNVVSSDQMGKFPDNNIGESVRRISGVTIQNDQGEARNIIIRGMAPQLNSVMVNGERIPSAEGDNRSVQMDLIPADMIQTVEVSKTLTPDMDADAIGGGVNLVTRSAPEKQRISLTGATGISLINNKPIWNGSAIYGNRFLNNKLGVVLSGSYYNADFASDNVEFEYAYDGDNEGDLAYVEDQQIRQYLVQRIRTSVSGTLDYNIKPGQTIFLKGIYNHRNDFENRFKLRFKDMSYSEDGSTEATVIRETKGGTSDIKNRRLEDQKMWNTQIGGKHLIGSRAEFKWQASTSKASEERPNERYMVYEADLPVTMDISNPEFPNAILANYSDSEGSLMELDEITEEYQYTQEIDVNGRADLKVDLNKGKYSNFIKVGGRYRNKEKYRDNNFYEYSDINGIYETMDNSNVELEDITNDKYLAGSQYVAGEFVSPKSLGALDLENESVFEKEDKLDEYVPGNYKANEEIYAGYAMIDQDFGKKLKVIAGVRVEQTNITTEGNAFNEDTEEVTTTNGSASYTNVLPGIHVKYDLNKKIVLRAAWTNTLARPNYYDVVPYQIYVPEDLEAEFGNANLTAAESMNFDLMTEYYNGVIGLISGGVFYKQIDNFIYTSRFDTTLTIDGTTDTWEVTTPKNGAQADVIGFELAIQRKLDFIPGKIWKNFSVYANYTYTQTQAKGIEGRDDNLSLEGTAGNMVNGSLAFDNGKLQVRASLNFTTDYIDEYGKESFFDRYYDKQMFLDVNASYNLTKKINVFASATNLTNQPLRYYQGISSRTMQAEYYSSRVNLGVKWNL